MHEPASGKAKGEDDLEANSSQCPQSAKIILDAFEPTAEFGCFEPTNIVKLGLPNYEKFPQPFDY